MKGREGKEDMIELKQGKGEREKAERKGGERREKEG